MSSKLEQWAKRAEETKSAGQVERRPLTKAESWASRADQAIESNAQRQREEYARGLMAAQTKMANTMYGSANRTNSNLMDMATRAKLMQTANEMADIKNQQAKALENPRASTAYTRQTEQQPMQDRAQRVAEIRKDVSTTPAQSRLGKGVQSVMLSPYASIEYLGESGKQAIKNRKAYEESDLDTKLAEAYTYLMQTERAFGYGSPEYEAAQANYYAVQRELNAFKNAPDKAVDMDSRAAQFMGGVQKLQEEALEGTTGAGRFLGEAALSIGSNLSKLPLNAVVPGASLALMGAEAAAGKAYELGQQGVNAGQALTRGLVSGGIEALTEKVPLDNLVDIIKTGGKVGLMNILKQAVTEAGEEGVAYLLNLGADKVAGDPEAEFVWNDFWKSVGMGALSGGIMGGGATAINRANTASVGKTYQDVAPELVAEGLQMKQDTDAYRTAAEMQRKLDAGKTLSNVDVGRVVQDNETTMAPLRQAAMEMAKEQVEREVQAAMPKRTVVRPLATEQRMAYTESNRTTEGGMTDGEEVHLRESGQRNDRAYPGGEVPRMEESAGRDQSGQDSRLPAKDARAADLRVGEEVSTASLGIGNGASNDRIRVVTGGDTEATAKARAIAKERGLRLTLFTGGNLTINGEECRAYITGDRAFVRADHSDFDADQLMRHEAGHDQIAKGEIDIKAATENIRKRLGGRNNVQRAAQTYASAFAGADMTVEEAIEEIICDSLGDMNVFSDTAVETAFGEVLESAKTAVAESRVESKTGPPVEGKTSKEHWRTDLNKRQFQALLDVVKKDVKTTQNRITNNANWLFANIGNAPVFSIYSTLDQNEPTVLYEVKGEQALFEKAIVEATIKEVNRAGHLERKAEVVNRLLNGSWVRKGGGVTNGSGAVGGRSDGGNAGLLRKQSERKPSAAFESVLRNLFQVQETESVNENLAALGVESDDGSVGKASRETNREAISKMDKNYFDAVNSGDMETAQRMVDEAAKAAGYPVKAYHGTARADRVGTVFRPDRATSGPMAFFTSDPNIAANYAKDKSDTSLAYDEEYDGYYSQFRVNKNGKSIKVQDLWRTLPYSEKQRLKEAGKHITWDDDMENIIWDDDATRGIGNWDDYTLREHKGNAIEALIDTWLESGELFGNEGDFIQVLELAGIKGVEYRDPDARHEKVYDAFLKIQNPFNTATVDEDFASGFEEWYSQQPKGKYDRDTAAADMWDKNSQTSETFLGRLRVDIAVGTSHAWTSIPDSVTDYLKHLKHDGIQDVGGKNGGESHTVWIPFSSEQVKSADPVTYDDNGNVIPLSERFNAENKDIRFSRETNREDVLKAVENLLAEAEAKLDEQELADQMYYGRKAEVQKRNAKEKLDRLREQKNQRIAQVKAEGREAVKVARIEERVERDERIAQIEEAHKAELKDTVTAERMAAGREMAAVKQRYKERVEQGRESRSATKRRAQILRHVNKVQQLLLRPTDKNHVPESLRKATASVLSSINTESGFEVMLGKDNKRHRVAEGTAGAEATKRTQAFAALKKACEEIMKNAEDSIILDPDLLGDSANGIPGLLDQLAELNNKRIADMNNDELDIVWRVLRSIEHSISSAGKVLSAAKYERTAEWADAFAADTASKRSKKGNRLEAMRLDLENPYTFFGHYGEAGKAVFRMLRDAQDEQQLMVENIRGMVQTFVDAKTVESLEKETHDFTTEAGDKLTLNTAQIMEIYLLMKREQAHDHLMKGGIVQPEVKSRKINRGTDAIKLSYNDLTAITKVLTDKQREIANNLQMLTTTTLADYGNEASMKVYGYKKFTGTDYWPIKSAGEGIHTNVEKGGNNTRSIKNIGMAKAVMPKASNALDINSVFSTFASHTADMVDYAAWLCPMEDANRLFNFQFRDEDGNKTGRTMKGLLDRFGGKDAQKYWSGLMEDIQNGIKAQSDTAILQPVNKMIGNVRGASVGANLRVIVQQPTAILRASAVLTPEAMFRGMFIGGGWKTALEHSPVAMRKDMGGFDISSPMQMNEILFDNKTKLQRVNEFFMAGAGKADAITWGRIWNACESEVAWDNKNLKPGTDEFYEKVNELFTEVIDQSQVVDGVLQRSRAMRSGNTFVQQATAFMGEPTMALNMMLRAYDNFASETDGKKRTAARKAFGKTAMALVLTNAINALAQSLVDALRDDSDEEYTAKVLSAFTGITDEETAWEKATAAVLSGNFGSSLNPVGYIPFAKDILSVLQGYNVTRADADVVGDIISSVKTFSDSISGDGKRSIAYATKNLAQQVSKVFGVSAANLLRDAWGIARTIAQETGNIELQYEMEKAIYKLNNDGNTSRFTKLLYKAYNADEEAYNHIYADMESAGVDMEKVRKQMEKLLKEDQGVTDVNDLDSRYLNPTLQKTYDSAMQTVRGDKLWDKATEEQQDKVEDILYELTVGSASGKKMQEKIDAGKAAGVDTADFLLYKLAMEMYDQPTENGKYGTYTQEEVEDAIKSIAGLSSAERRYFWTVAGKKEDKSPW